jgi:hypothetical protein
MQALPFFRQLHRIRTLYGKAVKHIQETLFSMAQAK